MLVGESIHAISDQFIDPEHSYQRAISETNKSKLMRAISTLANPYLESVNLRLAALITHEYPDVEGGYLLANAFNDAVDAYSVCAEEGGRLEACEAAYVVALVHRLAGLDHFTVHGVRKNQTDLWRPFETPLLEWSKTRGFAKLVFTRRVSRASNRLAIVVFLAAHLLTFDRASLVTELVNTVKDSSHVA